MFYVLGFYKFKQLKGLKNDQIFVIEVNPRASRSVPFVAKATGFPIAKLAAKILTGDALNTVVAHYKINRKKQFFAVKEVVFPFSRFNVTDVILGPEMKSTGEAIYFIDDLQDDYFTKVYSERNLYLSK